MRSHSGSLQVDIVTWGMFIGRATSDKCQDSTIASLKVRECSIEQRMPWTQHHEFSLTLCCLSSLSPLLSVQRSILFFSHLSCNAQRRNLPLFVYRLRTNLVRSFPSQLNRISISLLDAVEEDDLFHAGLLVWL